MTGIFAKLVQPDRTILQLIDKYHAHGALPCCINTRNS